MYASIDSLFGMPKMSIRHV